VTDPENQLRVDRLVHKTAWENYVFCFRPKEGLVGLKACLPFPVSLIKNTASPHRLCSSSTFRPLSLQNHSFLENKYRSFDSSD